ncbi:MFS general substrate transporter [Athelia psychrophila]|uniref:MFS general substrate transporter n=1 Tax=Athelia psychrophila TaxID=1759441 RepID=A0A167VJP5_9AGAM|nr:MFS general substrate transporter [Fibularhizoctonia sp. CBS 109695]
MSDTPGYTGRKSPDSLSSPRALSSFHDDQKALVDLYEDASIDPVYQAKARVINQAIHEIGMGRYQWYLFVVTGFGWFADSVWPLLSGLILSPVIAEFHFDGPLLSLACNIGLFFGAVFWGMGCDIWGRRWSFNLTLLIAGVFGMAAGGAQNFVALASLIAWPLIANYSCPETAATCQRADNMGWRYLLFILGGITILLWAIRLFTFRLLESPRYLAGLGKNREAVDVIQQLAAYNGTLCNISVEMLEAAEKNAAPTEIGKKRILSQSSRFTTQHIKALFATPKMAWSTSLLIAIWGVIGLASTLYNNFLPYLLTSRGAVYGDGSLYITYRNQVILSALGVPSALLAGYAVERPYIGRKGTLAIAAGLTGAFLFATTTARSSNQLLGWNAGYTFFSNIMYGVLYAISPEIFPAKHRGTGNGLTAMATRLFGILAPIIALYANLATAAPVYVSGALLIFSGVLTLLLPYEPQGKASI